MALDYIQMPADGVGKKVQAWSNALGPGTLYSEAITITDSTGVEKGTSTNPVRVDPTGVTVQPVSGTFWQTNQPTTDAADMSGTAPGTAPSNTIIVGAKYNSAAPTPTNGQTLPLQTNSVGQLLVAVGNTPAITGTVTANAGTNLNTSLLALETGGNLAIIAGAVSSSILQDNIAKINNVTPLMGNGVTGTGSQRVTIASDNTAFSVNATLVAGTAVIGHVIIDSGTVTTITNAVKVTGHAGGNFDGSFGAAAPSNALQCGGQDGSGNLQVFAVTGGGVGFSIPCDSSGTPIGTLTNFGTTPTAIKSLPVNASLFQGTVAVGTGAPLQVSIANTGVNATAIKVDGSGVTQPVSGTFWQTTQPVSGTVAATQSGTWSGLRIVGNAGGAFDAATNTAPPANAVQVGMVAATALPSAFTATDLVPPMTDKFGRQVVVANTVRDLVGFASVQTTDTSSHNLLASGGTGVFTDLISLVITNETATATVVSLSDGTVTYKFALAASGGISTTFPSTLPATSSATAWTVISSASVTLDFVVTWAKNK